MSVRPAILLAYSTISGGWRISRQPFPVGSTFAGIEPALRIEQRLEVLDDVSSVSSENSWAISLHLFHADAVLAGDRSADRNAVVENLVAAQLRASQFARLARIEQNDGVHVAVARVEDVADRQGSYFLAISPMASQRGGDLRARHHAVLHVVSRADAPDRAERVLAAFPEQVALFRRFSRRELRARRISRQTSPTCSACSSTASFSPSISISSTAAASIGIAGVRRLLHHAQHRAVEHFERNRQ